MTGIGDITSFIGKPRRLLILDSIIHKYTELIGILEKDGWDVQTSNDKKEGLILAKNFRPDLIIINLFLQNSSTLKLIKEIRNTSRNSTLYIIVVTSHYSEENIKQSIQAGCNDFIVEPFDTKKVVARIRFQLQDKDAYVLDELEKQTPEKPALEDDFKILYECLRILSEMKEGQRAIFETIRRVSEFVTSPRINVMMAELDSTDAIVVSSSDDENFYDRSVDLDRYPEVREVLLKGHIVYVKDISSNPLTKEIKQKVKTINIDGILVIPLRHRGETLGTLSLRLDNKSAEVTQNSVKMLYMVAMCIAPKVAAKRFLRKKKTEENSTSQT